MSKLLTFIVMLSVTSFAFGDTVSVDDAIADIGHRWAAITYTLPQAQKSDAYDALAATSQQLAETNPSRAEPLVWEAIALSGAAKAHGGLGALSRAKKARDLLLSAQTIDANTMDGSIDCTLGSLYANVPGWPIGFGDKQQARAHFEKALQTDPNGIDANFFYATFLSDEGAFAQSAEHFKKAINAPARQGRDDADAGRRAEASVQLAKLLNSHPEALGKSS